MNQTHEAEQLDKIAVIGMAMRFPGADTTEKFWANLCRGAEFVSTFSDEQLLSAGVEPVLLEHPNYVKAGVLLDEIEYFDAGFFGFTPRDAELMDPQHRIFLECAWEALEDAGYDPQQDGNRVGVFAGTGINKYFLLKIAGNSKLLSSWSDLQKMLVIDKDYLSTRVSYKLNLKGPSITVQSGCSTSLVAIHLACQSLLNGECDTALAGGVSIRIPQIAGYLYEQGSIESPDGHCRAFDAAGRGMVLGSGAGIVILKRLDDAVREGYGVRAVIRGSSINNDGADKIGYTAPSIDGQAAVIAEALAFANVTADEVTYVEAHGTGTALGDPIEIAALTKAFRTTTQKRDFCAIGSVKTNIGHLDAAAGVAGFIKVVLSLEHAAVPASLNYEKPNPEIDFAGSPFYVQTELAEWSPSNDRRIAGVSSFGIGGTNAHVVVEESPVGIRPEKGRSWQLLNLSARTAGALQSASRNLARFLADNPSTCLADVAFTLQKGRRAFSYRDCVVARDNEDAIRMLQQVSPKGSRVDERGDSGRPAVFMFPGQAAQYLNMARDIYLTEATFRERVDYCCKVLEPKIGFDMRDVLYPPEEIAAEAKERINQTSVTQPAVFVIEYALAELWMSWGVRPETLVGHSVGEYVAACLAGVFTLEEALTLIEARGRLMQELPKGSMLAVRLSEEETRKHLTDDLVIAVINELSSCVVAGHTEAVVNMQRALEEKKIVCRLLNTSHAFHSPMMEPALDPFQEVVERVKLLPPKVPFLSNLTGTWIRPEQATDPGYWVSQMRGTVRFADGISEMLKKPERVFLEVGPGQTLSSFVRRYPPHSPDRIVLTSFGYTKEKKPDLPQILNSLGHFWVVGGMVNWDGFYAGQSRRRVHLPTYPFERRRYWIGSGAGAADSVTKANFPGAPVDGGNGSRSAIDEASVDDLATEGYECPDISSKYVAPKEGMEERLAALWTRLLGVRQIGTEDNFFELGGDSLLATQVVSRIRDEFDVSLPLEKLFETPTINGLSTTIEDIVITEIEAISEDEAQRRVDESL